MIIELDRAGGARRRSPILRATDRRITFGGLVVAVAFLAVAGASLALPPSIRLGLWLPLHLALAGAATTAIAAVLPFFTAALAVASPVRPWIRIAGIVLVATGAAAAVTVYGHARGDVVPAVLAGGAFIAGVGFVAVAALAPLRGALGVRRRPIEIAYAVALADVGVGAALATLLLAGQRDIAADWPSIKPAHAWLNLLGFLSLTITATLVHLAPTIAGSQIRLRRAAPFAIAGLAVGPPLVAGGYLGGWDPLARVGGALVVGAGWALAIHGWQVQRDRARWTTEGAWHRLTSVSLLLGASWFAAAATVAGGRVVALGATPEAWSLQLFLAPLVVGFVVQVLIGAWSHLLPSIGPGDATRHALRRTILARWGIVRLVAINVGCGALWIGTVASWPVIGLIGTVLCVGAVGSAILLFAGAALTRASISAAAPSP
ncbi:MAG: hypothetical protein AABZ33_01135 [Chloroflexota bacterium]